MLAQAENKVTIEGILSEISVREGEFKSNKTGTMMPYLSGEIKIRVNQEINKIMTEMEVPVTFFASKYTNAGSENSAYKSINELRTNFTSLAAADASHPADRIKITGGSIKENLFAGRNGNVISTPIINASFFNKAKGENSEATFQQVICIGGKTEEVDAEGELTGALIIKGIVPQYGGKVDVISYRVVAQDAIDHINANWNVGDTVKIKGRINFTSKVETHTEEVGFGEPIVENRTITVKELLITGGSACGFEGDMAFDSSDIATALQERQERIASIKSSASAPKAAPKKNAGFDLGF